MPLLQAEAEKLSNNMLEAGVIEEIIDRDVMFHLMPFKKVVGKAYVYDRENTLSEAGFINPNDVVAEGAATFTEVVAKLRILIGDVDVDKFLDETLDDTNDQAAIQIRQKAKGLNRKYRRTLATGNSTTTPEEFDGLSELVEAGQTIQAGATGAALTLDMLDELIDSVPNGADALVMRSGTVRAYKSLLRATGGINPEHVQLENFTGRPVISHDGMPIIVNDFIANNETLSTGTNLTSIYAVRFNEVDGLHGIYGGSTAGVRAENIGTVQNKDANRFRLKWYVGTALKSTKSLARLEGITNI